MSDYKISKDIVRRVMKSKNIRTQTELAQMMGITKNQLSAILSPKFDPIKSNVRLLCDVLGVSFADIIEEVTLPKETDNQQMNIFQLPQAKQTHEQPEEFVDINTVRPNTTYNVLELFAGAGGLALGLEEAGFHTTALVEIDKYCCQTLRKNRPNWHVIEEDIVKVAEKGIRKYIGDTNVDLVTGGFPCQAFSYAGKKLGLEDVRGTMFYYFAAIVKELMPKMFLAENVRGLVSHDKGKTLKTIINVLEEIGYKVTYKVLKAVNYGVAQKRERIMIVGTRKDLAFVKYRFPKPFNYIPTLRDALKDVPPSPGAKYPKKKKEVLELVPPGGYWRDLPDEIAREYMGKSYYSGGGRTGMARRISWDEPCLTLTCSPAQKQTERCHPDEVRPFTVREYARIQSFPDYWSFCGSMNEQYKQIGNAVPVNLSKAVGLSIIDSLNKINELSKNLELVSASR